MSLALALPFVARALPTILSGLTTGDGAGLLMGKKRTVLGWLL